MDVVVTEELRERSSLGREIIETEEAVELVEQFQEAVNVSDPPVVQHPVQEEGVLQEALSDPNVSPGPVLNRRLSLNRGMGVSMEELAAWSLERARARSAERATQPSARDFLSRPYYEYGKSRFLFSCSDEPESYAMNRTEGWNYTLPEGPGGSSSSDTGR
jgi:hypothetical protein